MSDLFSQENFIWTLPLAAFTLLIILITCYFLRREISSLFKNLFFPDTQRYTVPASVISNVDRDGQHAALNKDKDDIDLYKNKKSRTLLRNMETNTRWGFRKLKHKITDGFAEIAGTEDAPSKKGTGIITREETAPAVIPQNAILQTNETQTAQVQNQDKTTSFIPEDIEEEYPGTTSEINTVIIREDTLNKEKEDVPSVKENKESLQIPAAIIEQETKEYDPDKVQQPQQENHQKETVLKEENKTNDESVSTTVSAEQKTKDDDKQQEENTQKQPFLSDRTALIIGLLILACFTIFLTAKVRLLSSLAIRNHMLIKDLQTQIEILRYEQNGVQVVIHERTSAPEKKI